MKQKAFKVTGAALAILNALNALNSTWYFLGGAHFPITAWLAFNACAPSVGLYLVGYLWKNEWLMAMAIPPMLYFGTGGLFVFGWSGTALFAQVGHIREKDVGDILFAGHRYKGKYQDIGKSLGLVSGAMGRRICGPAMSLDYEGEYKDDEADIEAGFPVARRLSSPGVDVRELKGGKAVTVTHRGPHETIGRSYELVFKHIHEKGYTTLVPCRVLYHKGPGAIFRGNPEKYVTEIQIFVK